MAKKKMMAILSILLMLDWILTGCSAFGYQGQAEAGVVRVWTTWGDDPATLQALFDRYTQKTGQTVKVFSQVRSDKLQTALNSATPPDIVILSSSDLVGTYAAAGLVEPLDALAQKAGIPLADFFRAPLAQCEVQAGVHACLPWGSDVFALFWNKDLFKAAGLDPEQPPRSMEELSSLADRLTQRNPQGKISQMGFVPDLPQSHTELYVRMLGGAGFQTESGKPAINAQPVIDAEAWQLRFFTSAGFEQANTFITTFDRYRNSSHPVSAGKRLNCQQCHRDNPRSVDKVPDHGFYSGKVAMMVDGEWQVGARYITAMQPQLNYGVTPFPPPADHPERANTAVVQGAVVVIPARLKDKEPAASLLAWMMSPEVGADLAYAQADLPSRRASAQDARFQQVPNLKVFLDLLDQVNASAPQPQKSTPEINQALLDVERDLLHKTGGDPAARLNQSQATLSR